MKKNEELPVDRGWAWMVVLGTFGTCFTLAFTTRNLGIIYAEIVDIYEVSAMQAAWIPALLRCCMLLLGPVAGVLCNLSSCRTVAFVGIVLTVSGNLLSFYVDNYQLLYLTFGILNGFGLCLIYVPLFPILTVYFKKRLALATGIYGMGAGLAGITAPLLYRYFVDEYGFKGSMFLIAGIYLQGFIFAALLRPKKYYTVSKQTDKENDENIFNNVATMRPEIEIANGFNTNSEFSSADLPGIAHHKNGFLDNGLKSISLNVIPDTQFKQISNDTGLTKEKTSCGSQEHRYQLNLNNHRLCSTSRFTQQEENCFRSLDGHQRICHAVLSPIGPHTIPKSTICLASADIASSMICLSALSFQSTEKEWKCTKKGNRLESFCCLINRDGKKENNRGKLFEWSLLKNPAFNILLVVSGLVMLVSPAITTILPLLAEMKGISKSDVAILYSIAVIPEPFTRVAIGWFSDLNIISSANILGISFGLSAICTFTLSFLESYAGLLAYSCVQSIITGVMYSVNPLVFVDMLGKDTISSSYSLCMMAQGITYLWGSPFIGWLFDVTGEWLWSLVFCGCSSVVATVLTLILPWVQRCTADKIKSVSVNAT